MFPSCCCHESGCLSPHYNSTSPMDYNSHHSLYSHIPIHHYTNHTAVTNHSSTLIVLPHLHLIHSPTYKQHTSPTRVAKSCSCPGWHFWAFTIPSDWYFCVWPRTALPWNSEPVLVTSTPAWYCLRLCSASDIPVIACWPLLVWFCLSNKYYCTWIHTPLTSLYSCMLSNNYFIPNWCRV